MAEETKRAEIFKKLSAVDVTPLIKKKNGLDYLSWANAWAVLMEYYPNSTYQIKEFDEVQFDKQAGTWQPTGRKLDYLKTEAGVEVEVEVNIDGETFGQKLYAMDFRNKAIKEPTYVEINKAQQRCLVKAIAMAGLGLNLYQGEDLPTGETIKRTGISKEQQEERQKLKVKKAAYFSLREQISKSTGKAPNEIDDLNKELAKTKFGNQTPSELEMYEFGIENIKALLKKQSGADKK